MGEKVAELLQENLYPQTVSSSTVKLMRIRSLD